MLICYVVASKLYLVLQIKQTNKQKKTKRKVLAFYITL